MVVWWSIGGWVGLDFDREHTLEQTSCIFSRCGSDGWTDQESFVVSLLPRSKSFFPVQFAGSLVEELVVKLYERNHFEYHRMMINPLLEDASRTCDADNIMMECHCGNFGVRLGCILTYNGSTQDMVINYLLVVVNLAYCVGAMLATTTRQQGDQQQQQQKWFALTALCFVVVFQIGICLMVGCSGVSIIWCALCGWIMSERRRQGLNRIDSSNTTTTNGDDNDDYVGNVMFHASRLENWEKGVVCLDVLLIVYYAMALPFITTVAHVCALILGAVLSLLSIKLYDSSSQTGGYGTSTEPLVTTASS